MQQDLVVGDLVMQVHDVQTDLNQVAEDLRYHEDFGHDPDWDEFYQLQREVEDIAERLDRSLNTSLMHTARVRRMPFTGSYFGSWLSTKDPWQRHWERERRRNQRKGSLA